MGDHHGSARESPPPSSERSRETAVARAPSSPSIRRSASGWDLPAQNQEEEEASTIHLTAGAIDLRRSSPNMRNDKRRQCAPFLIYFNAYFLIYFYWAFFFTVVRNELYFLYVFFMIYFYTLFSWVVRKSYSKQEMWLLCGTQIAGKREINQRMGDELNLCVFCVWAASVHKVHYRCWHLLQPRTRRPTAAQHWDMAT